MQPSVPWRGVCRFDIARSAADTARHDDNLLPDCCIGLLTARQRRIYLAGGPSDNFIIGLKMFSLCAESVEEFD